MSGRRRGLALLEVLVALTLLATAGVAWLALSERALAIADRSRVRERDSRRASSVLARVVAGDRQLLSALVGESVRDGFLVVIGTSDHRLFRIEVLQPDTRLPVLRTWSYPPERGPRALP